MLPKPASLSPPDLSPPDLSQSPLNPMNSCLMPPRFTLSTMALLQLSLCLLALLSAESQALPNDKNQALHISADRTEVNLKDGVVVWIGNAKLVQGTLEISAERLKVHRDKQQIEESVTAEGKPARFQQQPEAGKAIIHAEANVIHYNLNTEKLTLDQNVSLEQNGTVTKAGHVDYDTNSQTANFSTGEGKNRVETVIPAKSASKSTN